MDSSEPEVEKDRKSTTDDRQILEFTVSWSK